MYWNGLELVNEFSAMLSDEKASFKLRVLSWINEVQNDICYRSNFSFLKVLQAKSLTQGANFQKLDYVSPVTIPTVAIAAGGSLVEASSYKIKVTYYNSNLELETIPCFESASVVATAINMQIDATGIPLSSETYITARRVYMSKDDGLFYFSATISDNTTTTLTISVDTDSGITPPSHSYMRSLDGNPFQDNYLQLSNKSLDDLRLMFQGTWDQGSLIYWADAGTNRIATYPLAQADQILKFYFNRYPKEICQDIESVPEIPALLKPSLRAGVLSLGYAYRDREGAGQKMSEYEKIVTEQISRSNNLQTGPRYMRDVVGNARGYFL